MLREAMARLIAGRPRVTDGRLTVANLAREAGVGRSTANRAVDVLEAFHKAAARVPRPRTPEADTAALRSRDAAEIAVLKATVNQLAQQVQRMALHAAEQRRAIDALRAALAEATAGKIVPFPAVVSH
jgi:RIO-like serine/threonine protein kinase